MAQIRREFPALHGCIFLQHGGSSPMPVRALGAVSRAARALTSKTPAAWSEAYGEDVDGLKANLGRLLNVEPEDVALTRATAHGLSLVASGLDWRAGDNVVGARAEYPANLFCWQALDRLGVELRLAEPAGGRIGVDELMPLCDDRTRVVAVSFVQFWNGYRTQLAELGAECRRRGIVLVVDGIQGAGAVQIDLRATQVDLFAAGGYKWLLGPVGIGFCYIHPDLAARLQPPLIGVGTPDDPGTALEPRWSLGTRARRFEESASPWLDAAGLRASLSLLLDAGMDAVESRVLSLSALAGRLLEEAGCEMAPPWPRTPAESSGIVAFRHPRLDPEPMVAALKERGVHSRHISHRWVRFSTHFHNTEEEVERAVALVQEVAAQA